MKEIYPENADRVSFYAVSYSLNQSLEDVNDPNHITAVAYWESEEALDAWDNGPDRGQGDVSAESPWSKPVYRVRFQVGDEFKPE